MGVRLAAGLGPLRVSVPLTPSRRSQRAASNGIAGLLMFGLLAMAIMMLLPFVIMYFVAKYGYPPAKRFYTHPDQGVRVLRRLNSAILLAGVLSAGVVASLAGGRFGSAAVLVVLMVASIGWAFFENSRRQSRTRPVPQPAVVPGLEGFTWER